jgi:hypothetical protein
MPDVDFGIDVMLDNGFKLQIKSRRISNHPQYRDGMYHFDLRQFSKARWQKFSGVERRKSDSIEHYHSACDFLVFFCMTERRFFVVPCGEFEREAVYILPKSSPVNHRITNQWSYGSKMLQYEEAWHLLDVDVDVVKEMVDSVKRDPTYDDIK